MEKQWHHHGSQYKFTGASITVVRIFGPAVITNTWTCHWVSDWTLLVTLEHTLSSLHAFLVVV